MLYGVTVAKMSCALGLPVKLHFGIITKARTPVVQMLPIPIDDARDTTMKNCIAGAWEAIETGNFYPSPLLQNYTTCPFRFRCPVFGGK